MKKMKNTCNKLILLFLVTSFGACSTEDDLTKDWIADNTVNTSSSGMPGKADLSNLVALGTSLGAGFMDGALYDDGQANSFPALLGRQFQITGVGNTTDFEQPDINSPNGYNFLLNDGMSGRTELSLSLRTPVATTGDTASILKHWSGTASTLNNFSVPIAQAGQLIIAATGGPASNPAYNPFYERFASSPSTDGITGSSPVKDAISAKGTFFIYEAGVNDIALWAAGGGTNSIGPLTDAAVFKTSIDRAIRLLATAGTFGTPSESYSVEGVVLNVPPVLVFPFFQAVSYNAVTLDSTTAAALQSSFNNVNNALDATASVGYTGDVSARKVSYSKGNNPILVVDQSLDDLGPFFDRLAAASTIDAAQRKAVEPFRQSRPLVAGELVPLTTGALLGTEADGDDTAADTPLGVAVPLGFDLSTGAQETSGGDPYYLDKEEQALLETRRAAFNVALAGAVSDVNADGGGIILVDIESIFLDAAGVSDGVEGIVVEGITLAPDFSPNGIFSTDGIHPNNRGHGIIANQIISAIEAQWGASILKIDVLSLRGTIFIP